MNNGQKIVVNVVIIGESVHLYLTQTVWKTHPMIDIDELMNDNYSTIKQFWQYSISLLNN